MRREKGEGMLRTECKHVEFEDATLLAVRFMFEMFWKESHI
jgi:hypothetical protein